MSVIKPILLIPFLSILLIVMGNAQVLHNESIMKVNDVDLFIPADLSNTGFVENNGTITIEGNWRNEEVYQGLGTVSFIGDEPQQIDHNNQEFQNLVIKGGGEKIISNKVTIRGSLNLDDGLIRTSSSDSLLLLSDAEIIGGSEVSYIIGPLTQVGNDYKFYPVGIQGVYLPVEVWQINGGAALTTISALEDRSLVESITSPALAEVEPYFWSVKSKSNPFENLQFNVLTKQNNFQTRAHLLMQPATASDFSIVDKLEIGSISGLINLNDVTIGVGTLISTESTSAKFYISNTLNTAATNEDRLIKIFGDELIEQDFSFKVFNRWGLLIFESKSLQEMQEEGWDGRQGQNNDYPDPGSYPFQLLARKKNGEVIQKQGKISIIR